jgi:uncharacterized membrane protein
MLSVVVAAVAIAAAAMGGVFLAFSSFVMAALRRLPPAHGIAAMQSINIVAVTPVFMTALFGTAAASLAIAVYAVINWLGNGSGYLLPGSLSYLIGTIVVTIAFNVPLNNALAAADPASTESVFSWMNYVRAWTAWNHVRTVSGLVTAALLTRALLSL